MMKWVLRILYGFLIMIAGIFVISEADAAKRMSFLKENAQGIYEENDIDGFVEQFFVAASREKYITEPVYKAISNDEQYKFKFSIYQSRVLNKGDEIDVVVFALSDLDIKVDAVDQERYEENKNLVKIRVNIEFKNFPMAVDYNLNGLSIPFNLNTTMDVFIPFEVIMRKNESGQPLFSMNKDFTEEIEEITIDLIDRTSDDPKVKPKITKIAQFKSNTSANEKLGVTEELERKTVNIDKTVGTGDDKETITEEVSLMSSSLFNGLASRYDLDETYEENSSEMISYTDLDLLKPYNKIVTKYVSIYIAIVVVLTYLLFLLKPTINYFKNKRNMKIYNEEPKVDKNSIFKDE